MSDSVSMFTAVPLWFWGAAAFLVSACVGSFLNVVAARIPRGMSLAWPGSHCFTCGAPIAAHRNIPVLSWFILRGRCHDCRSSFSIRYALVELGFALLCTFTVLRHGGPTYQAVSECILFGFLFPLACIDLDTWTLPDKITWPGIIAGLILALPLGFDVFLGRLAAAAAGYGILFAGNAVGSRILNKEAMGGGDFMLFALIGAFLGPGAMIPVIFLSSLQGALVGIGVIALRSRKKKKSAEDAALEKSGENGGGEKSEQELEEEAEAEDPETRILSEPSSDPRDIAAAEVILNPAKLNQLREFSCKVPTDGWVPDAHSIPFGPFLALASIEIVVFDRITGIFFPWIGT